MMRLVDEIVEKAMQDHGNTTGHNAGFMVIASSDLESIIAAKLEPVRKAMSGAGKIAQAFGPEGYACRAFIKDALALLEDEG